MKGKIYHIARTLFKLPRPNEIWEGAENSWTLERFYQYADTCFSEGMSHATKPFGIVNTIVGFLVLFEVKDVASTGWVILVGSLLFFAPLILGHILFII